MFFNGNMAQVFGTLCCFSSKPFLKQLASHVSARRYLSAKIPGYEVFSHPSWALKKIFWKLLKLFA